MICRLRGKLLTKHPPRMELDVNGVGYELEAPMTTFYNLPAIGQEVVLFTHLMVREDAHALFGFSTESERRLFRSLIRVNGVGTKLALAILSGIQVDAFIRCVQNGDIQSLVRLPGIGKKTAERLIIEMRDRVPASTDAVATAGDSIVPNASISEFGNPAAASPQQEAISALMALGYKTLEAARMVNNVASNTTKTVEEIIRQALQAAVK